MWYTQKTHNNVKYHGGEGEHLKEQHGEKRSEETKRRKVVINFRFVFCYIYIILMLSITWKKITLFIQSHYSHTHSISFRLMTSHAQEIPLRKSILRNSKGEKNCSHLHSVSAFVKLSVFRRVLIKSGVLINL